jgi:polyisoprenoid-binding protein YceI
MTTRLERREPGAITTDRSRSDLIGTWKVDPTDSIVSFAWRALWLWTVSGRSVCSGRIHLDELPPVGVIRFEQPSSLPVLTMALDPARLKTGAAELNALLWGRGVGAVRRQRWWTLHSQSLEILPSGAWRVIATLTAQGPGLVELRLEADPKASGRDRLVLRGRGVLDRRAFAADKRASGFCPTIRLELAIRARRVLIHPSTERNEGEAAEREVELQRGSDGARNRPAHLLIAGSTPCGRR